MYDTTDILANRDVQAQLEEEIRSGSSQLRRRVAGPRYYSNCGKIGYNSRTY